MFPTANTFPRPDYIRQTRQHGSEQSGLVTLIFNRFYLESGVRSRLRPDERDRQTSDSIIA